MYKTFIRTWWKENPSWPNGLEPCAGVPKFDAKFNTEDEAREACQAYNSTHETGRFSRKMEYDEC